MAFVAVLLTACAARQEPPPCPMPDLSALPIAGGAIPPLWGALLTKLDYLDAQGSRTAPARILSDRGSLVGRWTATDGDEQLLVEPVDITGGTDVGRQLFGDAQEYFQLRFAEHGCRAEHLFRAAYGAFRVYGVDLDGDGRDEVVLERGDAGPSPYSYRRRLEIVRVTRDSVTAPPTCRFTSLFDTTLNGLGTNYINIQEAGVTLPVLVPHTWLRRYRFTAPSDDGRVGLELCVVKGDDREARVGSTDWTSALQFPRLLYRLDPQLGVFTLEAFDFRRLDAGSTGVSTATNRDATP